MCTTSSQPLRPLPPPSWLGASAVAAVLCAATLASAQTFQIDPTGKVLDGEPVAIRLTGLPPGAEVVVTAERPVENPEAPDQRVAYRSEARFKADGSGTLDLTQARPVSGSYRQVDPRGLFWSMTPGKTTPAKDWSSAEVRFAAALAGSPGRPLATASLELMPALPEVKTEPVATFPGAVFATLPGPRKRPAIIMLGGSEGGSLVTRHAAPLASHGFAVLALPYYSPENRATGKPELPQLPGAFARIPIERLNDARDWLKTRPDVDATRIAVYGTSKGAEFALLAGLHLPWVTSVVGIVATDVVWEGWGPGVEPAKHSSFALRGKPLPFVPYHQLDAEFAGFATGTPVRLRRPQDNGRAANPAAAAAARIPVERIKVPVLVTGGHDDQVWASGMMAQNIAERRAAARLDTVALIYFDAGHAIGGTGYAPTTGYDLGLLKVGGTPEGNARAQADARPKVIAFLRRTLGVAPR